jgi:hypothetical protein
VRQHGAERSRGDHVPARRDDVGASKPIVASPVSREGRDHVVAGRARVLRLRGADDDDERIVGRRIVHTHRAANVAGSSDDNHAVEPELLERLVERIVHEARGRSRQKREIHDTDAVGVLVREHPLGCRDDVGHQGFVVRVRGPDGDDVRVRRCAGVLIRPDRPFTGGQASHHGSVSELVADRQRVERGKVDLLHDAAAEVHLRPVDAGVDDCDRRRVPARRSTPKLIHTRRLRPEIRISRIRRRADHARVARDRLHVRTLGKGEKAAAGERYGRAPDDPEALAKNPLCLDGLFD